MPATGLVFPVLPGKESLIREIAAQLKERKAEHEESRRRHGISVERAYLQKNPDGSAVVIAYLDADRTFSDAMKSVLSSDLAIDRYFIDTNAEATGIDFRTGPAGPDPELVGEWSAPGARRAKGFAFVAPLQSSKTEPARQFAQEAYVSRRAEFSESRLAKKLTREEVFLSQTPMGDMIVVYLEGEDPIAGNREFAASNTPFDRWFKDQCKQVFAPYIDFDQPVPPNEEIFSWERA
jgi:Family of unknown function (DUF6176)